MEHFPRISIVTPSYNDAEFLEATILSVLDQAYPDLEYIIVDGGSTDGSVDIIRKYEHRLAWWCSEKDSGMYDALDKGFRRSSGEIMGWINSDDIHHPGSLSILGQVFNDFGSVNWIQGVQTMVDRRGKIVYAAPAYHMDKCYFYDRHHIKSHRYIQQESTFWRRSLWDKAGGYIATQYKHAGDFDLWIRFFRQGKLYHINAVLGAFRLTGSRQASLDHYDEYVSETLQILEAHPLNDTERRRLRYSRMVRALEGQMRRMIETMERKVGVSRRAEECDIEYDHRIEKFRLRQDK